MHVVHCTGRTRGRAVFRGIDGHGRARISRRPLQQTGRLVEKKIEPGRKLAALRDAAPSNKKSGWAVRKQFGIDDLLSVAEMMRARAAI
jgi:hypothetical protein